LAPVGDEGGESAAFDAVGYVVDCFADDVVSAADCEGLQWGKISVELLQRVERDWEERVYHAVAGELGICVQGAVCGGVVASSVHGIRASLVEGGWESHIACVPTGDCNFCHAVMMLSVRVCMN
jgi:hypothetical protein